jgi:DNA-binding MarR family transcriptional regulator
MNRCGGLPLAAHRLDDPAGLDDLFLYRLTRLLAVGGAPVIRLCEGRFGITRREWRLIAVLVEDGALLSSELASRAHLERGPTSKTVSLLVAKGLVRRTPRPQDRRLVDVAITDQGRAIYAALFPLVAKLNRELLAALGAAEVDQLDSMLQRLQQQAEAWLAAADLPKADRQHRGRVQRALPDA